MRLPKYSFLIVFLFLFGCVSPTLEPTPVVSSTARTPFKLPPTWTLTASVAPSETPVRTATLTFTPLPSVTPPPSTLTPSATSDNPTPTATTTITPTATLTPTAAITPTATITPALVTDCSVIALEGGVRIEIAPFYDPHRLRPTLEPAIPYQAVSEYPTYWELTREGEPVGWIDYRLVPIDIQGPDCDNLPQNPRELADFPGLCFFTPHGNEAITYNDPALTEPWNTISGTASYVVSTQLENAYFTIVSYAGPSFYVEASQVDTFGDCENVPVSAIVSADSWLWSKPNGQTGEQIAPLIANTRIYIQQGPVNGPKPPEVDANGKWYLVQVGSGEDGLSGWIWSAHFGFE